MTKAPLKPLGDPSHIWNKDISDQIDWTRSVVRDAAKTPEQEDMATVLDLCLSDALIVYATTDMRRKYAGVLRREHMTSHDPAKEAAARTDAKEGKSR